MVDGSFVITWSGYGQDNGVYYDSSSIFFQRFNADGTRGTINKLVGTSGADNLTLTGISDYSVLDPGSGNDSVGFVGETTVTNTPANEVGDMTSSDNITWVGILTPPVDIEESGINLTLTGSYTDITGNAGSGAAVVYNVDTIAPTTSVGGIDISTDTGVSDSDLLTRVASQTITGTLSGELGSGHILYGSVDNGSSWEDITSKLSGTTLNWDGATLSGSSSIVIKVSDISGNSGPSSTVSYTLDNVAPTTGWSSATDDVGSVTGVLTSGDSTDDTALVFSGTNDSGSVVNVYNGSTLLGAATITGTSWTYTAQIEDGITYQFNTKGADAAGNTGVATTNFEVTGDTTSPLISGTTAALDNSSIFLTFSEPVFTSAGGDVGVVPGDFALSIVGGTATIATTPEGVSVSGNVITLGLGLNGIPDGAEVLTVVPVGATAIFDAAGNAASATQSNNVVTLLKQVSATEDVDFSYSITSNAANIVSLSAPTLPGWLTLSDNGGGAGTLSGTPVNENVGAHSVVLRFTDSGGAFTDERILIVVANVNDAPVAYNQSKHMNEDTSAAITLAGGDVDGDALSYMIIKQPGNGALSGTAPNLTYTPNANFKGSDRLIFLVTDGTSVSSTATVNITVNEAGTVADTTAPGVPTVTVTSPTSDTTPDFNGTAEAGSTVTIRVDGIVFGHATAAVNGTYTFTPTTAMAIATHVVTVQATDVAGNTGDTSSDISLVIQLSTSQDTSITQYPSHTPMTIHGKVEHSSYTPVAGDEVFAYVGDELRAKASVQVINGVPYVDLSVNVDGSSSSSEYLTNVQLETAGGTRYPLVNRTKLSSGVTIGSDLKYVLTDGLTQSFSFYEGWNFVSMYLLKGAGAAMSPANFFGNELSKVNEIRTLTGRYDPSDPLNNILTSINRLELGAGYWVKATAAFNYSVTGFPGADLKTTLKPGWNMAGYPRREQRTVADVVRGLQPSANLVQLISDTDVYWTDSSLQQHSTLTHFDPGKGYWINVTDTTVWDLNFAETQGSNNQGGSSRRLTKTGGSEALEQFQRQLTKYPNIPAVLVAKVEVEEESISTGSLIGAFMDDELRGVQAVKQGESGGTVSLVIHTQGREMMSFRLWNPNSSSWEIIKEKYEVGSGDLLGASGEPILLTVAAKPKLKGLIMEEKEIRFEISPECFKTHKLQHSADLIRWEDFEIDELQIQDGVRVKTVKSREFFRLAPR
jgi:hypothetical protein